MEARKVLLAIPAHDQTVCASLLTSLVTGMSECTKAGYEFFLLCHGQDSNPAHARNLILAAFMASDCTDLLSVDCDVSWGPGTLLRILSHKVDFVGGTYRFKQPEERYPIGWIGSHDDLREANGLVEVARLPGGFMRMTREGAKRVVSQCDHLEFRTHFLPNLKCWYLYHEKLVNQQLVTEDYTFCDNIRALGERIYLDPEIKLDHTGRVTYPGNLDAFIARSNRERLPAEARAEHEAKLIKFAESLATPEMDRLLRTAIGLEAA
jgi:hypothetical protein